MPKIVITDNKGLVQSAGAGVESSSLTKFTNSGGIYDAKSFRSTSTANAAHTAHAAGALTVNTHYKGIQTSATTAATIPSAAAGNIGDWITVFYNVAIANGHANTFTTTTDTSFAAGSTAVRVGGSIVSKAHICDGSAKNVLTITGHTNGDGGPGTMLKFVNMTGATNGWAVEAVTLNNGDGTQAGTIEFS